MTPLVPPTIHSNGTSKEELVQQRIDVMEALTDLKEAMKAATPNARDYYPQGGSAALQAREAWVERMKMIEQLRDEVEMEAMKLTLEGL